MTTQTLGFLDLLRTATDPRIRAAGTGTQNLLDFFTPPNTPVVAGAQTNQLGTLGDVLGTFVTQGEAIGQDIGSVVGDIPGAARDLTRRVVTSEPGTELINLLQGGGDTITDSFNRLQDVTTQRATANLAPGEEADLLDFLAAVPGAIGQEIGAGLASTPDPNTPPATQQQTPLQETPEAGEAQQQAQQVLAGSLGPDVIAEIQQKVDAGDSEGVRESLADNLFNNPETRDLMLGVGLALLNGQDLGQALTAGVQMMQKQSSSRAKATQDARITGSEIELREAQAEQARANAAKLTSEAGVSGDALKQFNNTLDTIIGEGGVAALTNENFTSEAMARAAATALSAFPENSALQDVRNQNLNILINAAGQIEDEEERNAEFLRISNLFPGMDFTTLRN